MPRIAAKPLRRPEVIPTLRFFVPLPDSHYGALPTAIDDYWPWICRQPHIDAWGPYNWTLQSYLHLTAYRVPCELVSRLPEEGLVIAHRDFLPDQLRPGPDLYLASILADRDEPGFRGRHPWAQFNIVQNPLDPRLTDPDPLWPTAYVPYWPQPSLIARQAERGDRFETAAFFGYAHNLAKELQDDDWIERLHELGLRWSIPHRSSWHDYSGTDVVVAVRSFDSGRTYEGKPPSKMHNAWRAGVLAILGVESAFRGGRRTPLDYIEVTTIDDTLAALRTLKQDPGLRMAMVRNGLERARELRPADLVNTWRQVIEQDLQPSFGRWRRASPRDRQAFFDARARVEEDSAARRNRLGPTYPFDSPGRPR